MKLNRVLQLLPLLPLAIAHITAYAESDDNPCGGPSALLNLLNRPSYADSACIVPYEKSLLETGVQNLKPTVPIGNIQNFPEASFRVGIIENSEIVVLPPNYIASSNILYHGFTAATVGIKHKIKSTSNWILTAEALVTPPSGSESLGSTCCLIIKCYRRGDPLPHN